MSGVFLPGNKEECIKEALNSMLEAANAWAMAASLAEEGETVDYMIKAAEALRDWVANLLPPEPTLGSNVVSIDSYRRRG